MMNSLHRLSASWRVTLVAAIGAMINYGDRAAFSSVLPAIGKDLELSGTTMGLLGSLFLWSYALGSPVAGSLADRFSRRSTIIWSLALWSLVMVGTGFANSVIILCVSRVALGLTECPYLPASIALVGDSHPPSTRARGIGILLIGIRIGVLVGGAASGWIADHLGWRPVFWILGALGIALAVLFNLPAFLPRSSSPVHVRMEKFRPSAALKYLIRTPSYLLILTKVIFVGVASWNFFTWLPYYFHEVFHMNLASGGFAGTFLPEFTGLIGLVAGAWLSDRAAARNVRRRMLLEGLNYLAAAPFLLFFVGQPSLATISTALILYGLFRGLGDANEQSIVSEIIPSCHRATAIGIMNTCATMAGGMGVLVGGMLKDKVGLPIVFAGLSGTIFFAAVVLVFGYFAFVGRDIERAAAFQPAS